MFGVSRVCRRSATLFTNMDLSLLVFGIFLHIYWLPVALAEQESRIVGGETAKKIYPYQISLQVKVPVYIAFFPTGRKEWMHNCGGSILTPTCVLTAAHCVVDYKPQSLSILAGTSKLKGGGGKRYLVEKITVHPDYKELVTSDIAVMKINGTFDFNDKKIQPIKYSDQEIGGGVNCTLTGWGYTTPIRIGAPPNDLQVAVLPSITNEECREEGMKVGQTEICTYSRIGQGACGVSTFAWFISKSIVLHPSTTLLNSWRVTAADHWRLEMAKRWSE